MAHMRHALNTLAAFLAGRGGDAAAAEAISLRALGQLFFGGGRGGGVNGFTAPRRV